MPKLRLFFLALAHSSVFYSALVPAKALRDPVERAAYVRANPCPSAAASGRTCPGHEVDHTIPLCAGGPDLRTNMNWLTVVDHRFKTFVDVRECRKLRRSASKPVF